jgi:hypothetical protein
VQIARVMSSLPPCPTRPRSGRDGGKDVRRCGSPAPAPTASRGSTYLYHVVDNVVTMREYGAQCVVWQTALNPIVALELLASGAWAGTGVLGPEAFDAVPFLDLLATPKPEGYGSPLGTDGGAMTRYGQQFGPDFTFLGVPMCDLENPQSYAGADVVISAPRSTGVRRIAPGPASGRWPSGAPTTCRTTAPVRRWRCALMPCATWWSSTRVTSRCRPVTSRRRWVGSRQP